MHRSRNRQARLALLTAALGAMSFSHSAQAVSATWTFSGTNAVWTTGTNWLGGTAPGTVGAVYTNVDSATFGAAGNGVIDLNGSLNVKSIFFGLAGANASAFTIGDSNDTWHSTGDAGSAVGGVFVNAGVSTNEIVGAGTILLNVGLANHNFSNSGTGLVTINSLIDRNVGATTSTTVLIGGSGSTTFIGAIQASGTGGIQIVKAGNSFGAATLSNVTTNGSAILVRAGTLSLTGVTNTGGSGIAVADTATTGSSAVLNISANVTALNLNVSTSAARSGAVYQTGGNVTFTQGAAANQGFTLYAVNGSDNKVSAYYKISGGALTANEMAIGGSNTASVGVFEATGGTTTSNGYIVVGRGGTTSSGLINSFSGSTINATRIHIAYGATAGGTGALGLVNIAGAVNTSSNNSGTNTVGFDLGNGAGGQGIVNLLPGGVLTTGIGTASTAGTQVALNFNGGTLKAAALNAGTFFLTGANVDTVNVYAGGGTIDNNATAVTVSRPLSAPAGFGISSSTVAVPAGGLQYISPPLVKFSGGSGSGASGYAVLTNGVVTSVVVTSPGTGYLTGETLTANFFGGVGTINNVAGTAATNVINIAVAANANTGAVTFRGAGTTTLSGANTYGGATAITAGTLALNGTHSGTGAYTVGDGTNPASLAGSGSIAAAVTVNNAANLSPGGAGTSTFSSGALTLTAGSKVFEQLSATDTTPGSNINDLLAITGNLNLTGTSTFTLTGSPTNGNVYTLATYTGSLTGAGTITLASTNRSSYTLDTSTAGSIKAVASAAVGANLIWTGSVNANWNKTDTNFFNSGTSAADIFYDADFVTFNNTSAFNAVTLATTLAPGGVTIDNDTTHAYTFAGAGLLAGSGTLAKNGVGTFTIQTADTRSGGTDINAGTLIVGGGGTTSTIGYLGTGTVNVGASGTLVLNRSNNPTYSNSYFGGGSIILDAGGGSQTLGASSSFTGNVLVRAGENRIIKTDGGLGTSAGSTSLASGTTLNFVPDASASNSEPITVNGGTIAHGGVAITTTLNGPITLAADSTFRVDSGSLTVAGVIDGPGKLTNLGVGSLTLSGTNTFTGGTASSAGTLVLTGDASLGAVPVSPATNLTLGGGTVLFPTSTTLAANRNITFTAATNINTAVDATIPGVITSPAAALLKRGTGVLVLAGSNNFAAGTLTLGNGQEIDGTLRLTTDTALNGITAVQVTGDNNGVSILELDGGRSYSLPLYTTGRNNNPTFLRSNTGTNTWAGAVTVNGGGGSYRVEAATGSKLTLSGPFTTAVVTGTRTLNVLANGDLDLNGAITNGTATVALAKAGPGLLRLGVSNDFSGGVTIAAGTVQLNAVQASGTGAVTLIGGVVGGNGSAPGGIVADATNVVGSGVSPGASIGSLYTSSLSMLSNTTFTIEINNPAPAAPIAGTNNDVVYVTGSTLSLGSAKLQVLALSPAANYEFGQVFTIVDNATATITGLFADLSGATLSNGAIFDAAGTRFQINYGAGAGGDVTLTTVPEPTCVTLLAAGALLGRRRRSARSTVTV